MRERVHFEVRLCRFAVWRWAVAIVVTLAVSASVAWAVLMVGGQGSDHALVVISVVAVLALGSTAIGISLSRTSAGVLACRDGTWRYTTESGRERSGPVEVAIDLGSFFLLRLGEPGQTRSWLPVQRTGLEREWHALRCALYSPPPAAGTSPGAPVTPSR